MRPLRPSPVRPLAIPLLTLALLAAGCLAPAVEPEGTSADGLPVDVFAAVRDLVAGLPCDAAVPMGSSTSTENVRLVAGVRLDSHGFVGVGELDMLGDYAYVARHGTGGFSIVDVSDPLDPVEVGVWDPEQGDRGLDVKVLPDNTGVLMAGDRGVALVDVRDPTNPVLEAYLAFEKGQAHMLTVFTVADSVYVAVPKGNGQDMPIWRITGEPGERTFDLASSPKLNRLTQATGLWNPEDLARSHDAFFFEDPILGKPTLWIANVWEGIVALDVSDPANPLEIAWIPNLNVQYTHTVQTVIHEGRRITVSVSEVGVNTMKVFDTTNLDDPRQLAEWHVGNPALPQHNIQIVEGHVYMGHYDQGTFVFALDDLVAGRTAPVARFGVVDDEGRHVRPGVPASMLFGGVWDVVVKDGLVYTTDAGLQVYAFGCISPGNPAQTSTG